MHPQKLLRQVSRGESLLHASVGEAKPSQPLICEALKHAPGCLLARSSPMRLAELFAAYKNLLLALLPHRRCIYTIQPAIDILQPQADVGSAY